MEMKNEGNGYLYFDIPKQERDSAIAFLLSSLLKSRSNTHFSTHAEEPADEDVNIYLAHLLFAVGLPDYQQAVKRYLSTNVSDMTELVEKNDDRIVRYFIYKVNADNLMVHLGIFQDLEGGGRFQKTINQYASMAQNYYEQAAAYNRRIYRRPTAIGGVLEKLAHCFDRYQLVLHAVRRDFFHFTNHFNDTDFARFCEDVRRYETEERKNQLIDTFLDAYAEWVRTRDLGIRAKLIKWIEQLKSLDPGFSFQLE